jgi:hypothetical protein
MLLAHCLYGRLTAVGSPLSPSLKPSVERTPLSTQYVETCTLRKKSHRRGLGQPIPTTDPATNFGADFSTYNGGKFQPP